MHWKTKKSNFNKSFLYLGFYKIVKHAQRLHSDGQNNKISGYRYLVSKEPYF